MPGWLTYHIITQLIHIVQPHPCLFCLFVCLAVDHWLNGSPLTMIFFSARPLSPSPLFLYFLPLLYFTPPSHFFSSLPLFFFYLPFLFSLSPFISLSLPLSLSLFLSHTHSPPSLPFHSSSPFLHFTVPSFITQIAPPEYPSSVIAIFGDHPFSFFN
ncbi:hypothetical protein BKA57DRAFT_215818 [Linnemannia elongata]|nr:hypothetical protein BKA57DRAFT_215818 [Linnemannia elongata]